jgi:hypothetical protein
MFKIQRELLSAGDCNMFKFMVEQQHAVSAFGKPQPTAERTFNKFDFIIAFGDCNRFKFMV